MTPLNRAIGVQLAAVVVLVGAAATSDRWATSAHLDVGTALLVVAFFGIAVILLPIGLIWTSVLSWLEYRRGLVGGPVNRVVLFLGATVGGGLAIYALRYWGAL
jgi:hypothetical protein